MVVCAAGSMPGDLHKLWRARDPAGKGYHVEYGYSCMGYEIPGGMGVKLAAPEREVYVIVGDGSYLMLPGELVDKPKLETEIAKLKKAKKEGLEWTPIILGITKASLATESFLSAASFQETT